MAVGGDQHDRLDALSQRRQLAQRAHAGDEASVPVSNVDPAARVRALCELAVLRKGVEAIVLVSPDRHGGEPAAWWAVAEDFAARGYAVLVIAGQASQPVGERTSLPVVERAKRAETPRTIGRPRVRRITAPTKGGRA